MNFFRAIIKPVSLALVICGLTIACTPTPQSTTTTTTALVGNAAVSPSDRPNVNAFSDKQVVIDFADKVVIPTYQKFAAKTKDLKTAVDALAITPNEANLKAAQAEWIESRVNWEQGESFIIGPAKSLGLDAAIDTWPLDKGDIEKMLESRDKLTPESVKKLQESQKGYHAIEFVLFGANGKKAIADFTPREFAYVQALATVLDQDANTLLTAWTKGVDGSPAYRDSFATAGNNPIYPSLPNAAQEMVEGMIDSTTELAENKLTEPFKKKDASLIESQYAIANPLNDFRNNILCVKNVYFGTLERHVSGKSGLSSYIAKLNPTLDTRVDKEITSALNAIAAIPTPFYTAIADPAAATKIEGAIKAVTTLRETIEKDVKPLIISS
jgi:putative iron-regulated protein